MLNKIGYPLQKIFLSPFLSRRLAVQNFCQAGWFFREKTDEYPHFTTAHYCKDILSPVVQ